MNEKLFQDGIKIIENLTPAEIKAGAEKFGIQLRGETNMKHEYNGQYLSDIPFEIIEVGMEVIGHAGARGKIGSKTMPPFETDGFIRIEWKHHPAQSKFQSEFSDVAVIIPEPAPACVERIELHLRSEFFTFEKIARGVWVHVALFNPTEATREALADIPKDNTVRLLQLTQEDDDDDADEVHKGPYELVSVVSDPKNQDDVLHVLLKDLDLFNDVREE